MTRVYGIIGMCMLALMSIGVTQADDYVEDVYYWADAKSHSQSGTIVPNYNSRAREIIFIEDSTTVQHPDTVKAVVREVLPMEDIR
ncbi:MAG: hypothetical protein IJT12_10210 [Paludibacteraceae bacterium]|nr:hypothetical protein [Paludibacteraceae bacterium]